MNERLGDAHIVIAVVDADGNDVFGRIGDSVSRSIRRSRGQGNHEVIVLCQRVRELSHGFEVLPLAGIDGILGAVNGRGGIGRLEGGVELAGFEFSLETGDDGRGGIDNEVGALLAAGQLFARRVRGGVAGRNLHPVASIGQEGRIEGEIALLDPRTKQLPVLLAVSADVNIKEQIIAVVIVRGPAHRDGRAVLEPGERRRIRILIKA